MAKVEHHDNGATVTTESGEVIEASAVICTVPVGALSNIEFSPALPDAVQSVVDDKWNSQGAKIWIKIKGHHRFLGYAPKPAKMSVVRSEYFMDDDTTILVGFGYDNTNIDLNSIEDAQAVINQWRDDLEVVDTTGHNWVADKWAGQAWGTLRKGQFTQGWSLFDDIDSQLFFAGLRLCLRLARRLRRRRARKRHDHRPPGHQQHAGDKGTVNDADNRIHRKDLDQRCR